MTTWADMLDDLPTIAVDQTADLKVATDDLRVWLSRLDIDDGEPFRRTVYVEAIDARHTFVYVGYFDGDETSPHPTGRLGDAFALTADVWAAR
jgi:hypothetical protein